MKTLKKNQKIIIGMIHLPATLSYEGWPGLKSFIYKAKKDLLSLENGGADAALIENDADHPCQVTGTPDVIAPMVIVAYELAQIASIPLGIEVLLNDPKASLAIAKTCGLGFVRTDYFVDKMTRENYGELKTNPAKILKYRHQIKADNIKIFADIQVKYATMVDKNKTIDVSAKEAIRSGADGIIVTGSKTGEKPILSDLKLAKIIANEQVPIIIGSGFSSENALETLKFADWAIVGSSIKTNGYVDVHKVKQLMKQIKQHL